MRVWGCVAHVLIPNLGKDKLLTKTKRHLFVDYLKHSKGCKLYDLVEKIIIESSHIKFIKD